MSKTRARGWEQRLLDVFDDLEQQAEGLALVERDAEVADLAAAEYAGIDLSSRLRASVGQAVALRLRGGWEVAGQVLRGGPAWVLVGAGEVRWLVDSSAVLSAAGASKASAHPATTPVGDRSSVRTLLRRVAEAGGPGETAQVHLVDGHRVEGRLGRVGADFVELATGSGHGGGARGPLLVALGGVAAVRWAAW